jgi:hypothetical protein
VTPSESKDVFIAPQLSRASSLVFAFPSRRFHLTEKNNNRIFKFVERRDFMGYVVTAVPESQRLIGGPGSKPARTPPNIPPPPREFLWTADLESRCGKSLTERPGGAARGPLMMSLAPGASKLSTIGTSSHQDFRQSTPSARRSCEERPQTVQKFRPSASFSRQCRLSKWR